MNTIKVAAVAVVLTGGYLVYSLSSDSTDISSSQTVPAVDTAERASISSSNINSASAEGATQSIAIQSNLPEFDLTEYNESERLLEQLSYTEIPPERRGNIGEFIDPDDETYQPVITNPGSIGEFIDPDDDSYQPVITNPGSIGEFIDPDDETYTPEIINPGHIGEPIDVDALFQ